MVFLPSAIRFPQVGVPASLPPSHAPALIPLAVLFLIHERVITEGQLARFFRIVALAAYLLKVVLIN